MFETIDTIVEIKYAIVHLDGPLGILSIRELGWDTKGAADDYMDWLKGKTGERHIYVLTPYPVGHEEDTEGWIREQQDRYRRLWSIIRRHDDGGWLSGGDTMMETAFNWWLTELSPEDAEKWIGAGCFDPDTAQDLQRLYEQGQGLSPQQAAGVWAGMTYTYAYAAANGDIDPAHLKEVYSRAQQGEMVG